MIDSLFSSNELDGLVRNTNDYQEAIRRLMARLLTDNEWANCTVLGRGKTNRPGLPPKNCKSFTVSLNTFSLKYQAMWVTVYNKGL